MNRIEDKEDFFFQMKRHAARMKGASSNEVAKSLLTYLFEKYEENDVTDMLISEVENNLYDQRVLSLWLINYLKETKYSEIIFFVLKKTYPVLKKKIGNHDTQSVKDILPFSDEINFVEQLIETLIDFKYKEAEDSFYNFANFLIGIKIGDNFRVVTLMKKLVVLFPERTLDIFVQFYSQYHNAPYYNPPHKGGDFLYSYFDIYKDEIQKKLLETNTIAAEKWRDLCEKMK